MNKILVFILILLSVVLINLGVTTRSKVAELKDEMAQLESSNLDMKQQIRNRELLSKQSPVPISKEYSIVMNQIRLLESYSGTSMNVQLDGTIETPDIASHYEDTVFKGIRGLRIKIVVDKFSKETDMGAVLDDIHLLEKNTDFMATEISKDNNNLIVKGEIYGL